MRTRAIDATVASFLAAALTARSTRPPRRDRSPRRRRDAHPRSARPSSRPSRRRQVGCGRSRRSPFRARRVRRGPGQRRRPRRRCPHAHRASSHERPGLGRDPAKRVVRRFADAAARTGPPASASSMPAVTRAAARTSSAGRSSSAATGRTSAELAAVGPWAGHLAGAAAAIALVTPNPATADAPLSILFDLGQAAENMMLAAWELGIGSVPATVYEHDLARELLGLPGRPALRVPALVRLPGRPGRPQPPAAGRRPSRARRDRPRGALVGQAAHCHWNLRAAIAKHTTSQPRRTAAQTDNGAKAAPPTMTWRSASAR